MKSYLYLPEKTKKGSNISAIIVDDNTITEPIEMQKTLIISLHQWVQYSERKSPLLRKLL